MRKKTIIASNIQSGIYVTLVSLMIVFVAGCSDQTSSNNKEQRNEQVAQSEKIVGEKGPDGQPIIFWRITQRNRDAIAAMLDTGYDIEAKGGFDATPIIWASLSDDWITVLLLLERGANPMIADRRGFTLNDLMNTTRVDPNGSYGVALQKVRALLKKRGISDTVYDPPKVKEMLKNGEWPPAQ